MWVFDKEVLLHRWILNLISKLTSFPRFNHNLLILSRLSIPLIYCSNNTCLDITHFKSFPEHHWRSKSQQQSCSELINAYAVNMRISTIITPARGQHETKLFALSSTTRASARAATWRFLACPGLRACSTREVHLFWCSLSQLLKPLSSTKLVRSRLLDIGLVPFFACFWPLTPSRNMNTQ